VPGYVYNNQDNENQKQCEQERDEVQAYELAHSVVIGHGKENRGYQENAAEKYYKYPEYPPSLFRNSSLPVSFFIIHLLITPFRS
jgi:hypothetical protein